MNKKFLLKATGTLVLAGMVFGGPAAEAADLIGSQGEGDGFIAGNAVDGNVDVPLAACGVGVAGGGVATGACDATGPLASSADDMTSADGSGNGFIAGNAIAAAAGVPIAGCGLAGTLLGVATGACKATGPLATTGDDMTTATAQGNGEGTGNDTTGASGVGDGLVAGNAVAGDLDVPVAACGLAAGLGGVDTGTCDATGPLATTGDDTTTATAQGNGVGTGNAVALDADVPIAACGGGVALLGVATGACG